MVPPIYTFFATSTICDPANYVGLHVDELAVLFDTTIRRLLDQRVPLRQVTVRQRSSANWYDDECRQSKRRLRRLERDARRDGRLLGGSSAGSVLWRDARRQYVKLLHQKQSAYWTGHIEDNRSNPRRLWQHLITCSDVIRIKPVMLPPTSFTSISRKSLVFEQPQTVWITLPSYLLQSLASSDCLHLSR